MKKTHRHTLNCRSVYKHICENLDADINSAQCREIRAHIAGCDNCTAYLDSLKKTVHLYRAYPTPRMPAQSHKKLIAAIALNKSHNIKQ
jgi:predicted anti-sigma-YlaC factor YlaD